MVNKIESSHREKVDGADRSLDSTTKARVYALLIMQVFSENLADEQHLALAYTAAELRDQLGTYFALDRRLGQIVAKTTEPMLGQMRLAWWRDVLAKTVAQRPSGDEVLDAVSSYWVGNETALIGLVDGWEIMLAEPPLRRGQAKSFAHGRAQPLAAMAGADHSDAWQRAHAAGVRWALADAVVHLPEGEERSAFIKLGLDRTSDVGILARKLRGLAVMESLALRSLKAGGRPLMEGRGASLVAFRVGLLGR